MGGAAGGAAESDCGQERQLLCGGQRLCLSHRMKPLTPMHPAKRYG
jgi:hypothetical protein